jgi:hypothetical protein
MVGEGNVTVKRKKPAKKKPSKDITLNLSGVKFEDAVRIMLNTPPLSKVKK